MIAAMATPEGILAYAGWALPDFEETVDAIAVQVRGGATDSGIAEATGRPIALVAALLNRFELMGWVTLTRLAGGPGHIYVDHVSPQLRRQL